MPDYKKLAAEIAGDPLGRGYAGMTDQQVAESLNTADRDEDIPTLTAGEIFDAIVIAEYQALNPGKTEAVQIILGLAGDINVTPGSNARTVLLDAFGAGTTTRANLTALVKRPITRAQEIGFRAPTAEDIGRVR